MRAEQLLALIPDKDLEALSAQTSVDHQVKKLTGALTFKLLVMAILNPGRVSLRVMERLYTSATFRAFANAGDPVKYNSIRDRIATMNADFFERLYAVLYKRFAHLLDEKDALVKVDSTVVSLSAKLVDWTLCSGGEGTTTRQVKYTVAMRGSLPCTVKVFTESWANSEDVAIPAVVLAADAQPEEVFTFDRGVQSRKQMDAFSDGERLFVGRLRTATRAEVIEALPVPLKPEPGATVKVDSDEQVWLRGKNHRRARHPVRLIKATILKTNKLIYFVTNTALPPYQVAALYRRRWEVETFFQFIKQHLDVNHLVVRNLNGIKVMLYVTLIVAMLVLVYKKSNRITSYKEAKECFEIELHNLLIREIVLLCGGDPTKANHLWNTS